MIFPPNIRIFHLQRRTCMSRSTPSQTKLLRPYHLMKKSHTSMRSHTKRRNQRYQAWPEIRSPKSVRVLIKSILMFKLYLLEELISRSIRNLITSKCVEAAFETLASITRKDSSLSTSSGNDKEWIRRRSLQFQSLLEDFAIKSLVT